MDMMKITRELLFEELERYTVCRNRVRQYLIKYECECREIILRIKNKEFDDTQEDFDKLFNLQGNLAGAYYGYDFELSDALYEFMYEMDGDDDILTRRYWYNKFKEGLVWPVKETKHPQAG